MMKRIIVAIIAVPLLLAVIFFTPLWGMGIVTGAIAGGAAWELLRCTAPEAKTRMKVFAALSGAAIPLGESLGMGREFTLAAVFVLFVVMFCELMASFREEKPMSYNVVALAMFSGAVVPILLASLVRLGEGGRGAVYIMLPLVAAFSCDSGAYFVGKALGKHKLAPKLSPNKTKEGAAGGLVIAAILMLGYGFVLRRFGYTVDLALMALYGVVGGIICQIGDLSFSAIKRESGIKDYGNVIPGHGGMLDRFDSMVFTAPAMELLVIIAPAIS